LITNPFSRKPKTPLDQALDVIDNVRSDAAETAAQIRDAAAKAADVLGVPTPDVGGRGKLPVLGVVAAAGLGVAIAIRARGGKRPEPTLPPTPTQAPKPTPAAATAAKVTAKPSSEADTAESRSADETKPEEPREPKAETAESDPARD